MSNVAYLMPTSSPPSEDEGALIEWRLRQVESTVRELEQRVDKLVWALSFAALSFAGSAAVVLITYLNSGHP